MFEDILKYANFYPHSGDVFMIRPRDSFGFNWIQIYTEVIPNQ